jgi:hypothetical protein
MSKNQYQRVCFRLESSSEEQSHSFIGIFADDIQMKSNALEPGQRPRKVYVLIRVFNLLGGNIGMRIFVDPYRLKGHILQFDTGPWLVTPRSQLAPQTAR